VSTITITIDLDNTELASNVYDNLWRDSSPWIEETNWDWENPSNVVTVVHEDGESDSYVRTDVSTEMLAKGLQYLLTNGHGHCGVGITVDFDHWDACVSDMVLQAAIFGKVIFG
jgi:hypothetical protein